MGQVGGVLLLSRRRLASIGDGRRWTFPELKRSQERKKSFEAQVSIKTLLGVGRKMKTLFP